MRLPMEPGLAMGLGKFLMIKYWFSMGEFIPRISGEKTQMMKNAREPYRSPNGPTP